ncbi:amino acid adenylation domain-containing protein [Candidatus Binatus sp.]|uniref:amino acid adenylation domain-containing protein n=1 Tax=Candidatus Binatus sp. TaxID=2811406 RepID=UPI003CC59092
MDLPRLLEKHSSTASAIFALGRQPLSYTGLFEHCVATTALLNGAGISRGDRIAVVLPNGPEMATCFLAVAMGASCAPLNPAYRRNEFEFYLSDLAPKALIVQDGIQSPSIEVAESSGIPIIRLRPSTDREAGIFSLEFGRRVYASAPVFAEGGDEALVLHTSGTTARPKMVPLTHANLSASAANIAASLGLDSSDRCLNVMPLFHIHGLVGALLATIASGASIVCTPGFQAPRFLDWCEEFAATWYTAVPTMHQAVLARAHRQNASKANLKLRFVRSCSAALAPQLMAEMEQTFRVPVVEAYGMTEASHQIATNPMPPRVRKPGSVGRPAGAEIAVMDESGNFLGPGEIGEIVLRGPGMTAGYAQNPEANRMSFTNGWFRTGDQGRVDSEGYLFITGRLKEIINRGGQKISPREIEQVLGTHPAVAQTVAFAVPDHRLGEEIAAAVVLRAGHAASEIEIRNHAARRIADYKVPQRIVFLDELPKGPTGKVRRVGMAAILGLDRPDNTAKSESRPSGFAEPRTPIERAIADIWRQVLGVDQIGVNDDFLALGGDSMLAALAIARIREPRISLLTFFEHPTIAALAEAIDRADSNGASSLDPIVAVGASDDLPLSSAQRRIWFLTQFENHSTVYNRSNVYRIRGPLDRDALERALNEIVARHAVLRTTYRSPEGDPRQKISPTRAIAMLQLDLSHEPAALRLESALRAAAIVASQDFDLVRDLMLRAWLAKLGDDDHMLALTTHHIASDGWSAGVLMRELAALYAAFRNPESVDSDRNVLEPLSIQYGDFAAWQARSVKGVAARESLEWWKNRLAGAPPFLALSTDRPRPPRQTFSGAVASFVITREVADRLKEIARGERATLFMTLLAAFQTLLHRYTGTDDIVVGAPVAGRGWVETEGLIGPFVNTLAMRGDLAGDPTFHELLTRTRDSSFAAYAHQDLPFEMIVEATHPQRSLSYPPIFQVTFQVRNYPFEDTQLAGLEVEEVDFDPGVSQFDLSLEVTEKAGRLFCRLIYNVDLFDRETISRMATHFETLLDGIVNDPEAQISRLPLLTADERRQLLVESNDTRRDYTRECVHRLFEAQVDHAPGAIAVNFSASRITYAELNGRANQIARMLLDAGVTPRSFVAICIEHSPQMLAGLLGILKAGAAYVPLDPGFPRERLDFLLEDSAAPVLVTTKSLTPKFAASNLRVLCIDEDLAAVANHEAGNPKVPVTPEDDAYVIYTSGSTGKPKGVAISHGAFSNLLDALRGELSFTRDDALLAVTTLSFDMAAFGLFLPLICGGRVALPDEYLADGARQMETIAATRPTLITATPSLWRMLIASGWSGDPKVRVIAGGEALTRMLANQLLDRSEVVFNTYGPTEATIISTIHRVERGSGPVPIGHPLANVQLYVLDSKQQPLPVGVVGELYIGGEGVAGGYLGRPELTAERFVANPFESGVGTLMYRTGDTVRRLRDGDIEFIGRADDQLKVRGIRIEPGEIEAALARHPKVRTAAVVGVADAEETISLVAFVEAKTGEPPTAAAMRAFLGESMPVYMIPTRFVLLDRIALTPNSKVDRAQLPSLDESHSHTAQQYLEPRDDIERRLQTIWEQVLNIRPIGVRHEFFDLGGHSLNAAKVLSKIAREFNCRIPLAAMFPAPTIESLAARIRDYGRDGAQRATVPIQPHGSLPPLFVAGNFQVFKDLAQYLGRDQPMIGLTIPDDLRMRLPYNLEEFAASQVDSILKCKPAGPYLVAGFSAEGVLAFAVAQQLRAKGRDVGLLVMIDTACPNQPRRSWIVRTAINVGAIPRKFRDKGIRAALSSLSRRAREVMLRIGLVVWRIRNRSNVESEQSGLTHPADFYASLHEAAGRYAMHSYEGPTLLFKRPDEVTDQPRPKDVGWSGIILNGLEIVEIPGNHWTMLSHPSVGVVAKKLEQAMHRARQSSTGVDTPIAARRDSNIESHHPGTYRGRLET